MVDSFKNYDNLLSSLNQANMEQRNANITLHQTKAGVDASTKVLGEMKLFISGKPALEKISKNIARPLYDKYGKEFVDNKIQSLKNKLGYKSKETPKPEDSPDGTDQNAEGSSNKPPVEDDATESPEELNQRLLTEQTGREARLANEADEAEQQSSRTSEVNDILSRGAKRAEMFEKKVASGDAEGEELIAPIRNMKNPFADNLEDYRNSDLTDFSQARTSFTANDLGASGVNETYDRANGLTDAEKQTVSNNAEQGINADEINAPTSEALNTSGGTFQNSVAQSRASVQPNVKSDAQTNEPDDWDKPPQETEDVAKTTGKTVAEETAETGGEEGGISILDSIPGVDIFGAIGGAILAGIMAHREKKQEEAEKDLAPMTTNVDTEIGLSGTEALA